MSGIFINNPALKQVWGIEPFSSRRRCLSFAVLTGPAFFYTVAYLIRAMTRPQADLTMESWLLSWSMMIAILIIQTLFPALRIQDILNQKNVSPNSSLNGRSILWAGACPWLLSILMLAAVQVMILASRAIALAQGQIHSDFWRNGNLSILEVVYYHSFPWILLLLGTFFQTMLWASVNSKPARLLIMFFLMLSYCIQCFYYYYLLFIPFAIISFFNEQSDLFYFTTYYIFSLIIPILFTIFRWREMVVFLDKKIMPRRSDPDNE